MNASNNIVAIPYSFFGASKIVLAGLAVTIVSGLIAFRVFPDVRAGSFAEIVGYIGLALFGVATIFALWRMLTTRGPVVTLSETGLRDIRIAAEEIPWTSILTMATWELQRQKILVLGVDPAFDSRVTLTRMARLSRGANARMGADGLCVATQGLKIDHETLTALCAERIRLAHAGKMAAMP